MSVKYELPIIRLNDYQNKFFEKNELALEETLSEFLPEQEQWKESSSLNLLIISKVDEKNQAFYFTEIVNRDILFYLKLKDLEIVKTVNLKFINSKEDSYSYEPKSAFKPFNIYGVYKFSFLIEDLKNAESLSFEVIGGYYNENVKKIVQPNKFKSQYETNVTRYTFRDSKIMDMSLTWLYFHSAYLCKLIQQDRRNSMKDLEYIKRDLLDLFEKIDIIWTLSKMDVLEGFKHDYISLRPMGMKKICVPILENRASFKQIDKLIEFAQVEELASLIVLRVYKLCRLQSNSMLKAGLVKKRRRNFSSYYKKIVLAEKRYRLAVRKIADIKDDDGNKLLGEYEKNIYENLTELIEKYKSDLNMVKVLRNISCNYQMREILQKNHYVGVVGATYGCGKSSLVNRIIQKSSQNNMLTTSFLNFGPHRLFENVCDSINENCVLIEYPYFTHVNTNHQLQFYFTKNLLNFAFLIQDVEKLNSSEFMTLRTQTRGVMLAFVLNKSDLILRLDLSEKEIVDRISKINKSFVGKEFLWTSVFDEELEPHKYLTKDLNFFVGIDFFKEIAIKIDDSINRYLFFTNFRFDAKKIKSIKRRK